MFQLFLEFYVHAFAVLLPAGATAIIAIYALRAGLPRRMIVTATLGLATLFALWHAGAAAMTEAGLIMPPPTLLDPPYVMMFLIGGAVLLWALARLTSAGRSITDTMGQDVLIGVQSFRVMGWVFVLGWALGAIPWQFALPAGLGDIWAGVAGYRAMRAVNRGAPDADAMVFRANIIGLADFAVAVFTGLITSQGFLHLLAQDNPNIINAWPLGLFPAFFVPIFIAFHLLSLGRLRAARHLPAAA
ncbi:hypothetical protein QKW60_07600 [Defluviimonas aestuarii]|uniref:hypothetical protein n=1 Tax=Albidovulum aestuarii TaxID=1130726 RepID=UPI00249AC771|nr:hypothetical protein [Defluviimonas aestuarii]MDI3336266.1 hypothetical protein [Defluviimonas aestuarii]